MYEIKTLDDIHANQVAIYSIKSLLAKKSFPKFAIFAGYMGVGKSSVAKLVASQIDMQDVDPSVYNFGLSQDMGKISTEVFMNNPVKPRAVVFEELQGLSKENQTALLNMIDRQPSNVYIIATTTEEDSVLRTLRSRAQVWTFRSLSNKQLSVLLDDYLEQLGKTMDPATKRILIQGARGIPRDLVKSVDLALNGEFDEATMSELLGSMSDDLAYSVFVSLKSDPTSFAQMLGTLMEQGDNTKVGKLRDFWTRFYIESISKGGTQSIDLDKVETLSAMFSPKEIQLITKSLIAMNNYTMQLHLVYLNSVLNSTGGSNRKAVGVQKTVRAEAETELKRESMSNIEMKEGAKLSKGNLEDLKLT